MVILCPQWLAKLLTYLLTNLLCQPAGPPLALYAQERNKKGLLREELLEFSIEQFLTDEVKKSHRVPQLIGNDVIDLMLKFKLMADVTATSLAPDSGRRLFVVPHLLPVEPFVPATDHCHRVLYYFPGHFIPDSLVDQLTVRCAEWNKQHKFGFLR